MSRARFLIIAMAAMALSFSATGAAQSPAPSSPAASQSPMSSPLPGASCPPAVTGSQVPASPDASMPLVLPSAPTTARRGAAPGLPDACVGTHVAAQLMEMAIGLDVTDVPAGPVVFDIANVGTVEHEFVVIATDLPADQLPVKDGVVDETLVQVLGEAEAVQPGGSTTLSVELQPGHYVIICNIPGHYLAGMRTELIAR